MTNEINKALAAAIQRLLRSLVRLLLRHGISHTEFSELAKRVYVDVADREFPLPGRKQSVSRISVLTGLTRKEVSRLQKLGLEDDSLQGEQYNRAARVISGWLQDARFHSGDGKPLDLPVEGRHSFAELVKDYSGDIPVRAILDELQRVGAVECLKDGHIRLKQRGYVPADSDVDKLYILGTDVADLVSTIDHNLERADDPYFQRKVAYDNLPEECLAEFRQLSGQEAQKLLEHLNDYLSRHDRDSNPQSQGSGRKRAGIGIYYFEQDMTGQD